jgi:hypothetical protein
MRFFASAHIPRTPFRVGFITGAFGGHHPSPKACTTCGQEPRKSALRGWLYILGTMAAGVMIWNWIMPRVWDLIWLVTR